VRALLESGADPTITDISGITPTAIAKPHPPDVPPGITAEGRRECVTALEVRPLSFALAPHSAPAVLISWLTCLGHCGWQEAERAYLLWKARQVADQQGSGAVAVPRGRGGEAGEAKEALVDFAVKRLKGTCSGTSRR
jgi:hypothetical protein